MHLKILLLPFVSDTKCSKVLAYFLQVREREHLFLQVRSMPNVVSREHSLVDKDGPKCLCSANTREASTKSRSGNGTVLYFSSLDVCYAFP